MIKSNDQEREKQKQKKRKKKKRKLYIEKKHDYTHHTEKRKVIW